MCRNNNENLSGEWAGTGVEGRRWRRTHVGKVAQSKGSDLRISGLSRVSASYLPGSCMRVQGSQSQGKKESQKLLK